MLRVIDTYWMRHIDTMSELRQGVSLTSIWTTKSTCDLSKRRIEMFNEMIRNISKDVTRYAIRAQIQYNVEREAVVKNTQPIKEQLIKDQKNQK
jgi:preprotein translocase subunit SecA